AGRGAGGPAHARPGRRRAGAAAALGPGAAPAAAGDDRAVAGAGAGRRRRGVRARAVQAGRAAGAARAAERLSVSGRLRAGGPRAPFRFLPKGAGPLGCTAGRAAMPAKAARRARARADARMLQDGGWRWSETTGGLLLGPGGLRAWYDAAAGELRF